MRDRELPEPPLYNKAWLLDAEPPGDYTGLQVDFTVVRQLITLPFWPNQVKLNGKRVKVQSLILTPVSSNTAHPIYFELIGKTNHYRVLIWRDRVVVEVHDFLEIVLKHSFFPQSEQDLLAVLDILLNDRE